MRFLVVGMGRMGQSIVSRLVETKDYSITAIDPIFAQTENVLRVNSTITCHADIDALPVAETGFDVVLLAFKPQMFSAIAPQLRPFINKDTVVISIMAGIELKDIRRVLKNCGKPVRTMPNIAALVGYSSTSCYADNDVSKQERDLVNEIFTSVGSVNWLQEEEHIHLVTSVSGSGPAYFYAFCETLTKAAEEMGLPSQTAKNIVIDTFIGAAKLLESQKEGPEKLRHDVTSQGGTTEAALQVLLQPEGLPNISRLTTAAAVNRSKILAQSD